MEPIAPVSATAATVATRDLPVSPGALTVGQVVQARVAKVEGDTVLLRWGEQMLSVASKVPLTVGQQVNLLVEEGTAGKTLLRMLDENGDKGRSTRNDVSNSRRQASGPGAANGQSATGP